MTTAEIYRGSHVQPILDQLTTHMGIPNRIGAAEEARTGTAPRVTWVPPEKGTRSYSGTSQQRPDLGFKHVHDVSVPFLVHLWASSYHGAEELERRLETALYELFSPNAYELGPEGEQVGDNSAGGQGRGGWLFIVPVRLLRVPIPVETYRRVTLSTATATGQVTTPKGGSVTPGPDPSTTYP